MKYIFLSGIEPNQAKQVVKASSHVNNSNSADLNNFLIPCDTEIPTPVNLHSSSDISLSHANNIYNSDDSDDSDVLDTFELNIMKVREIPMNSVDKSIHISTNPIKSEDSPGKCNGLRKKVIEMSEHVNELVSTDKKPVSLAIELNREQLSKNTVHKQLQIHGKRNSIASSCIGKFSNMWSGIIVWYSSLHINIQIILAIVIVLLLLYILTALFIPIIFGIRTYSAKGELVIKNCIEYHYLFWMRLFRVRKLLFKDSTCKWRISGFKLKRMYSVFIHHI